MQMKLKRDQRKAGIFGGTMYSISLRVEFTEDEERIIQARKLWKYELHEEVDSRVEDAKAFMGVDKTHHIITVEDLKKGLELQSKDSGALTRFEKVLISKCQWVKDQLEGTKKYSGGEEVIEFDSKPTSIATASPLTGDAD
jgi:hypothetical protein